MNKTSICLLLGLFLAPLSLRAQTLNELGTGFPDIGGTYARIVSNNLSTPFIAYVDDNKMMVQKFIAGEWVNTAAAPAYVDTNVLWFDIEHNSVNDKTYLLYAKGDGIYFRVYDGSWGSASHIPATTTYSHYACLLAIDEANDIPYIIYKETNSTVHYAKYNFITSGFESIPAVTEFTDYMSYMYTADWEFNQEQGKLYFSFQWGNDPLKMKTFDGTSWSAFYQNSIYEQQMRTFLAFRPGTPSSILLASNYDDAAGYWNGVKSYFPAGGSLVVEPAFNSGSQYATLMAGAAVNPVNNYYAYIYNKHSSPVVPFLRYYSGTSSHTVSHNLGGHEFLDVHYDQLGNMYLLTTETNRLHVYRIDHFTLGVSEEALTPFRFYPNPAADELQFEATEQGILRMIDMNGQQVLEQAVLKGTQGVNTGSLQAGCYLAEFQMSDGRVQRSRIVIE